MIGRDVASSRLRGVACAGLVNILALVHASSAWAAEECGPVEPDGNVVCEASGSPYGDVDYNGADGIDLTIPSGAVVNGSVSVLGDGDIKVTSEEGSAINGQILPALDIGSTSGTVTVTVAEVTGGLHGVAAVAGGDVTVSADKVDATIAIQAESVDGNVFVEARELHADGDGGAGVVAVTGAGSIQVNVNEVHSQNAFYNQGVAAFSESGDIVIEAGSIDIDGFRSEGIRVETYSGDVSVKAGSIDITGGEIVGISVVNDTGHTAIDADSVVLKGSVARGIFAASFAEIDVNAGYVETHGFIADGIQLLSTEGDIRATVGEIVTKGDWSAGISAETGGSVSFDIGSVTTRGEYSDGVGAFAGGDVTLNVDNITVYGNGSSGVIVGTSEGDQTISVGSVLVRGRQDAGSAIATSTFSGKVDIEVRDAAVSLHGRGIVTQSVEDTVAVTVAEDATVSGKLGGIWVDSGAGSRIDIAGTVTSSEGYAIEVTGAGSEINIAATGTLPGNVLLSERRDVLTNGGRFLLSGDSDFGGGNDRLVNGGVLGLAPAEAPVLVRLQNLERLDNQGVIDLANGRIGDRLVVSGELAGSAGGSIALDVSLKDRSADTIRVGSLAGTTELRLDYAEKLGGLGLTGLTLLTADGDASGGELVLAEDSVTRGFVDFALDFNAGRGAWQLSGGLNDRGYRTAVAGEGARDLWREGVRAWSHQLAGHRGEESEGLRFWTHGFVGKNEREAAAASRLGSRDLAWSTDHNGVQLGVEKASDGFIIGLAGGYGSSETDFGAGEESRFDALNAAAYAGYSSGGWFANAMLRADWLDVETDWSSVGLDADGEANMLGAAIELGHRADFGGMWLEPFVAVQWIDLDLPDLASEWGRVRYSGGTTVTGEAGVRLQAKDGWAGLPFEPSLLLALSVEGGDGDRAELEVAGDRVRIEEDGTRSYGRAGLGIAKDFGRFGLFAQGEARFGDVEGYNAVLGAKLSF